MKRNTTRLRIENVLEKMGYKIVYDRVIGEGGVCIFKGQGYIIVNKNFTEAKKISILLSIIKELGTDNVYLPPFLRRMLNRT